ncbi:PREDICTED: uncharacterized protein LOC108761014 [Trachymyrmex cornetzi]|uniref:uncharacterized protein LOC108761014 n=1 Tax=Trachymyrmex cornetzi TaxID=471704 RepID=UPI00084F3BEE|nr:PREDICTED: uncharacterized protein LOC108761014 [Trachymyrmex cornetzi]
MIFSCFLGSKLGSKDTDFHQTKTLRLTQMTLKQQLSVQKNGYNFHRSKFVDATTCKALEHLQKKHTRFRVRSGRRYSRYLALQTVRGAADNANKHVTNGSVLRYNCASSIRQG